MSGAARLRAGRAEDAPGLAALHVEVWRETYGALAPPEAIAQLDEARRLPAWRETLAAEDPLTGAILAEAEGRLLGVIAFGRARAPELGDGAEIRHLYVRTPARGQGLGQRLTEAAMAQLSAQGCHRVALAVVRENAAARRFYRRLGGTETGAFTDPGPLWRSSNIVVTWALADRP